MPFTQLPDVNILHNLGTFIRTKKGNIRAILLTADCFEFYRFSQ